MLLATTLTTHIRDKRPLFLLSRLRCSGQSPRNLEHMWLGAGEQEHLGAWSEPQPQTLHHALLHTGTGSRLGEYLLSGLVWRLRSLLKGA